MENFVEILFAGFLDRFQKIHGFWIRGSTPNCCGFSNFNYWKKLSRKRKLALVDLVLDQYYKQSGRLNAINSIDLEKIQKHQEYA